MADSTSIKEEMQVLGSDGGMVGVVDRIESDGVVVRNTAHAESKDVHHVPLTWIARVDDHVHLDRPAALIRKEWTAAALDAAPDGHTALGPDSLPEGAGTTSRTEPSPGPASVSTGAVPNTDRPVRDVPPPSSKPIESAHTGMGRSWIVWVIGAVLLLIIVILGIRGCAYGASDTDYATEPAPVDAPAN